MENKQNPLGPVGSLPERPTIAPNPGYIPNTSNKNVSNNLYSYMQHNANFNNWNHELPSGTIAVKPNINSLSDYMKSSNELIQSKIPTNSLVLGKPIMADFRNPNIPNQFIDRYKALGDVYTKNGISPFRDNERFYNEHTSSWDDFQRSTGQMFTLLGLGFKDSLAFGAFSDTNMARKYERAIAIGNSNKGGVMGFTSNLFLNAGYTFGIMGEIIAENLAIGLAEMGLGAATGASEGLAAPITLPTMAALGAKFTANMTKASELLRGLSFGKTLEQVAQAGKRTKDTIEGLSDINNLRKVAGNFGTFMRDVHIGNTYEYLKNFEKLQTGEKYYKGVASVYKDIRNIKAAYGESALEAGMVENEMNNDLYNNFVHEHGRNPNEHEIIDMKIAAKSAATKTAFQNLPLIFYTNGLTLGMITRPIDNVVGKAVKARGRQILVNPKVATKGIVEGGLNTIAEGGGEQAIKTLSSNYFIRQGQILTNWRALTAFTTAYASENFAEGFQEVAQDIIHNQNVQFYTDKYKGNVYRGGYYDYVLNAMGGQLSKQGFETFMSGFLMQKIAGPISHLQLAVESKGESLRGTMGETIYKGAEDLYNKVTKSKQKYATWKTEREERETKLNKSIQDDIDKLKELFNTKKGSGGIDYFSNQLSSFAEIAHLQDTALAGKLTPEEAEKLKAAKEHAFTTYMRSAVNLGKADVIIDYFKSMKKLSNEEIESDFGMDGETFKKNIDTALDKFNFMKNAADYAAKHFKNEVNIKPTGNFQIDQLNRHHYNAYNEAVDLFIYHHYNFNEALDANQKILNEAGKSLEMGEIDYHNFSLLYNKKTLNDEIERLDNVIKNLKQFESNEHTKKELKHHEARVAALKEFEKAKTIFTYGDKTDTKAVSNETLLKRKENLLNAYKSYIDVLAEDKTKVPFDDAIEQSLEEIIKYDENVDRSEQNMDAVRRLLNPKGFAGVVATFSQLRKYVEDNKDREIKESIAAYRNQQTKHALQQELEGDSTDETSLNVMLDPKQLEELLNGKSPDTLRFFNLSTNAELSIFDDKYKAAMDIVKKHFPHFSNMLTFNKVFTMFSHTKLKNDKRTLADLEKEYGFDLSKESQKIKLKDALEKIIKSEYTTNGQKELANFLLSKVTDADELTVKKSTSSVKFNKDTEDQWTIDPRYASADYSNENIGNIEYLILKATMGKLSTDLVKNDSTFKNNIESFITRLNEISTSLRNEDVTDKDFILSNKKDENGKTDLELLIERRYNHLKDIASIKDAETFIMEAMTNEWFQILLSKIKFTNNTEKTKPSSVWDKFIQYLVNVIMENTQRHYDGTLLNAATLTIIGKLEPKGPVNSAGSTGPINTGPSSSQSTEGSIDETTYKEGTEASEKAGITNRIRYKNETLEEVNEFDSTGKVKAGRILQIVYKVKSQKGSNPIPLTEFEEKVKVKYSNEISKIINATTDVEYKPEITEEMKEKIIELNYNPNKYTSQELYYLYHENVPYGERINLQGTMYDPNMTLERLHKEKVNVGTLTEEELKAYAEEQIKKQQEYEEQQAKETAETTMNEAKNDTIVNDMDEAESTKFSDLDDDDINSTKVDDFEDGSVNYSNESDLFDDINKKNNCD